MFSIQNSNNKLYIYQRASVESASTNSVIEITPGNYSASALNAALQIKLQAAALGSASYACNYNSTTQRLTITQTNGSGFLIYDDQTLKTLGRKSPLANGLYGTLPVISNPQSLQQVLNIPQSSNPDVIWASGMIILARVTECYLKSPDLTSMDTMDSNGRYDVLRRIPLSSNFGTLVVGSNTLNQCDYFDVSERCFSRLSFQLTDSHGNVLDLHNHDWSFALCFLWGDL
jgi:hypothetical protein